MHTLAEARSPTWSCSSSLSLSSPYVVFMSRTAYSCNFQRLYQETAGNYVDVTESTAYLDLINVIWECLLIN